MKANMKKRRIFEDAVDLMTGETTGDDGVKLIPISDVCAYHNHPFRLYEGERLENMVDSIKGHGILSPVIVQEMEGGSKQHKYEILSGHNRINAAKMAGMADVPAIVKKGLTEEEAYIYVIETNVMQRSFAELLPSEKAAVMSEHYQKICGTMRKDEILMELDKLNLASVTTEQGGHNDHQKGRDTSNGHDGRWAKTRDIVAAEYGFSSRNAARYLRINHLIQPFKDLVDNNRMPLLAGVNVSYLTEMEQNKLHEITSARGWRISQKTSSTLRKMSGTLTDGRIVDLFEAQKRKQDKAVSIRISDDLRNRYFDGMDAKQMLELIERAMNAWYEKKVIV